MATYTTKASASYLYKSCTFLFEDFDLFTKFFSTPSACKTGSKAHLGPIVRLSSPSFAPLERHIQPVPRWVPRTRGRVAQQAEYRCYPPRDVTSKMCITSLSY